MSFGPSGAGVDLVVIFREEALEAVLAVEEHSDLLLVGAGEVRVVVAFMHEAVERVLGGPKDPARVAGLEVVALDEVLLDAPFLHPEGVAEGALVLLVLVLGAHVAADVFSALEAFGALLTLESRGPFAVDFADVAVEFVAEGESLGAEAALELFGCFRLC